VIELVRDPRAALASRKHRRTDEWLDTKEAQEQLATADRTTNYDTLIDSYMWKESIDSARDARRDFPGRVLSVRYEDMVSDPETTIHAHLPLSRPALPAGLSGGWLDQRH
jgi:hypothetical protein